MNVFDDFTRLTANQGAVAYRGLGDAIIESADDAIISKDLNGIIRSWNPGAERLFGYTPDEAIGQPITMLIAADRQHEEIDILARVRRGERVEHYETVRRTKDGREIPVSLTISPIKNELGRIVGASKIARDIRDRIDAEHARGHLAAIIESADDAIIGKDLNGVIRSWNKGAERLFGYTADEAIGQSVTLLMPPERQHEEPQILARLRRGERIEHYETVRVAKNGRRIPISLTTSPVRNSRGQIIGASKIARDISQRIAAENALKDADLRKDQFLAMLAHELRNPLTPIRNGIEIIQRSTDQGRREWAMQVIDRQLIQLTRIIDDLLEIARITSGNITLRREATNLRAIVKTALESARPNIDAGRHTVKVDIPTAEIELYVDAARLVQALVNLLVNSAKFTAPGGSITIVGNAEGDQLVLRVRDSGRGIASDLLPRVFDVFSQGASDYARTEGGLGIGLSIVRRVVEMHGGTVTAYSEGAGQGSEFRITLPLAPPPPATASVTSQADVHHCCRVLVVDDNPDVTDSLAELLTLNGHQVERHYSGAGVLDKALAFRPNVVVLDLGLPERDGFDVARDIRARPELHGALLIAVSGYGQPADIERTRAAGINFHLLKPVETDELLRLIAGHNRDR